MQQRSEYLDRAQAAADFVRQRSGLAGLTSVLQCGSGLNSLIDAVLPDGGRIPMDEIPHFPASRVPGHGRELIFGSIDGQTVGILAGRIHLYEGHDPLTAGFPAALAHACGAERFILTNAAGGLNQHFSQGSVMLITDFINFQGDNALAHLLTENAAQRFVDPKPATERRQSTELGRQLQRSGLSVNQGTYIGVRGPIYETRAELAMMRSWGADAIGMSTIPELTVCHALGLPAIGVSVITNECFGDAAVTHGEVVDVGAQVSPKLGAALRGFLEGLA
ncbi:purine-nucleoside phosphorylase [bacterium]|nr:purine-nucleoside phosphorylase [bacterium]